MNLRQKLRRIRDRYFNNVQKTGVKIKEGIINQNDNQREQQYLDSGRIPWSPGYKQYRIKLLQSAVRDVELLKTFKTESELPEGYGFGVDERIVEYPWILSRLDLACGYLLDAGSTLNYPYLVDLPTLVSKTIVIMTLAPEHMEKRANVSYLYDDLRDILIRDNVFETIVCISTLEHVGLDNTMIYTKNSNFKESSPHDYRQVMSELRRVLKPGGRLLLTVPFGRYQDLGWLQQFDIRGIEDIIKAFGIKPVCTIFSSICPKDGLYLMQIHVNNANILMFIRHMNLLKTVLLRHELLRVLNL